MSALSESELLVIEPGFPVERRTIFGISGDDSDMAVSLEWCDTAGCKWVADFTEESLASAAISHNRIALKDSEGEIVRVDFYDLKAGKI